MQFLPLTIFTTASLIKGLIIEFLMKFLLTIKLITQIYVYSVVKFFIIFQNHLDPNSKTILHLVFFLGYVDNPTAYKILDLTNNKIVLSRNVEFFEFTPGNSYLSHCNNDITNFITNNIIRRNDNNYFRNNTYDTILSNNNQHNYQFNNSNNIPILNYDTQNNENNTQSTLCSNNKTRTTRKYNKRKKLNIKNNISIDNNSNDQNNSNNNKNNNKNINDSFTQTNKNDSLIYNNYNDNNNSETTNINRNNNDNNSGTTNINYNNNNDNNSEITNINCNNNNKNTEITNTSCNNNNNHNNFSTINHNLNYSKYNSQSNVNNIVNNEISNIESLTFTHKRNRNDTYTTNLINKKQKLINKLREPNNYDDILNLSDKNEWLKSVKSELNNMKELKVYETINTIPKGANLISSRWIFKYKRNAQGEIVKRKSRLVAKGFTQEYGIDYKETFAPTLKQDSIRIFTAIATQNNFEIDQIDITAAYLNAELNEDLYMKPSKGHEDYNKRYWKLKKAIYGLKQSGAKWNEKLNNYLISIGYKRLVSEPCLYVKHNKEGKIISLLAIYVDDILISGTKKIIEKVKLLIKKEFKIKDIGNVDYIIGIKFIKHKNGYFLHQHRYINELLNKYNMNDCAPIRNMCPIENENLKKIKVDETKYRSIIGNLLYLSICTRPDIIYSVSKAARKAKDPNMEDWNNVLRILRYLKGTDKYGIYFNKNSNIKAFVDSDYGGDLETRRSTTGFLIKFGTAPTSWCSKLQKCISTSTAESEYYSLSECGKHCMWYLNLLKELNININSIEVNVDNIAAIYNAKNQTINPKTKHVDIRVHYIREIVKKNKINLNYVKSENNIADGFTKYLNGTLMDKFRNSLLTKIDDLCLY